MDSSSLERFSFILNKELNQLTEDEISFIKARQDYLNPIQKQFYKDLIGNKDKELNKVEGKTKTKKVKNN